MKPDRILIVDDNFNNIQVLAGILESNNFAVEFALNGPDALHWLHDEVFDIVLLDVMMPQMDGYEVCRRIRGNTPNNDIPVVFLTAKTDRDSIVKGFESGGNDYIAKPYDQRELLARVATHLELKKNRDQLASLNNILEEKVAERTRELQDAMAKMQAMNSKLLELDEAKSEFLRLISHEIRTPLNGIVGFAEILKATHEDNPIIEYIDLLEVSAKRLERFAHNALMLTTLRLNKRNLKTQPVSPLQLAIAIVNEISLKGRKVNCVFNIAGDSTINGDEELIRMCLTNIIRNAFNYAEREISISSGWIGDENKFRLIFKDDGPGFSKQALDNLFGFFSKGEKHVDGHEGLGLALCKQIMATHGGDITAGNANSGGAEVIIDFPVEKGP